MTMIITFVSRQYIAQASDRRVTYNDGRVGEVMNKAVVIGHFGCAAYTGLAFIDGRHPTDEFLMQATDAAMRNGGETFERLARDASRAVRMNRGLPIDLDERMRVARTSFVVAAFAKPAGSGKRGRQERVPVLSVISNAQFDLGESWAPEALPKFSHLQVQVAGDQWILHVAGQPMPQAIRRRLVRNVARAVRKCSGPEAVARLISRAIQKVHETNAGVGPSVNCVMLRDIPPMPSFDELGQETLPVAGMMIPLGVHALREANFFTGPRGDVKPEPVASVFLPHPEHPEVALGPSVVIPGLMQMHSPLMAPEPIAAIAAKAVADLRAGRVVELALPKQFRQRREPRTLP